jgi:type III restriction enzyme
MRITLRPFQEEAVDRLTLQVVSARDSRIREVSDQAVGLAAPTGSGKTVIATALIERILFGGDDTAADPGATFLWITDQPELNTQTRDKMLATSSLLGPDRLVVIDNTFDAPTLDPARVWFLNTQKLGVASALVQGASDERQWSFWETVRGTIEAAGRTLYVVIDEAHRGMIEGARREEANSIIQKFIKGTDLMPPAPVVIGITATPDRFNAVIEGTDRTTRRHVVSAADVRASGLIKDRILASHAGERQTDPMALLVVAAQTWHASSSAWSAYCASQAEAQVVPAFVVQIENEADGRVSATDLDLAIRTIAATVGPLPDNAYVHAIPDQGDLVIGGRTVRHVVQSRISDDTDALVIFFKTSLNQGWDCPRAEVMFSFRRAADYTSIAQLIGRMVRAPLARRVEEDERLNAVDLFLPNYDRDNLARIVTYLTESGDGAIAQSVVERSSIVALPRAPGSDAAVAAITAIPNYVVPTARRKAEVRRLVDLARALSAHGLDPEAASRERAALAGALLAERERLAADPTFVELVTERGEVTIRRVEWAIGAAEIGDAETLKISLSDDNLVRLFGGAKRVLGGEAAVAYWQTRVAEDPTARDTARLEAVALATRDDVLDTLNEIAHERIESLFETHGPAIEALTSGRRSTYERLRGQASAPSLAPIHLPEVAEFTAGGEVWPRHLFATADGTASLPLNSVEVDVVREELANPAVLFWLRVPPRKDWSFCVPFTEGTVERPLYPDFLFVRQEGDRLLVDIIDPHDPGLEDAARKAAGLARYAQRHGHLVGRIDLVARIDGRLSRIHLKDDTSREAVAAAMTPNALRLLFPLA